MDGTITDKESIYAFELMNLTFTIIFTVEMGFKLIAYTPRNYVKDLMRIFDGTVVIISLVELMFL